MHPIVGDEVSGSPGGRTRCTPERRRSAPPSWRAYGGRTCRIERVRIALTERQRRSISDAHAAIARQDTYPFVTPSRRCRRALADKKLRRAARQRAEVVVSIARGVQTPTREVAPERASMAPAKREKSETARDDDEPSRRVSARGASASQGEGSQRTAKAVTAEKVKRRVSIDHVDLEEDDEPADPNDVNVATMVRRETSLRAGSSCSPRPMETPPRSPREEGCQDFSFPLDESSADHPTSPSRRADPAVPVAARLLRHPGGRPEALRGGARARASSTTPPSPRSRPRARRSLGTLPPSRPRLPTETL